MKRILWRILNPLDSTAGYAAPHAIIAAVVGALLALSGVFAVHHFTPHGGLKPPKHLPAGRSTPLSGSVPLSGSLDRFVQRIHDQGASNSCVGQTISTISEIESAERHAGRAFSAGFIYDPLQSNGQGITYDAGFGRLRANGDAPYSAFPHDGQDYWVQPSGYPYAAAYPWRSSGWRYIALTDRAAIQSSISHGVPVAFAAPWYSSWVNHYYSTAPLPWPAGALNFWHSLVITSFSPYGVEILNSWGAAWGSNGHAWLSWDVLAASGGFAAVSDTVYPYPTLRPILSAYHVRIFQQYRREHHKGLIPYTDRPRHLTFAVRLWLRHHPAHEGGITRKEQWYPRGRHGVDGYEKDSFQGGFWFFWPRHKNYRPHWVKRKRWLR